MRQSPLTSLRLQLVTFTGNWTPNLTCRLYWKLGIHATLSTVTSGIAGAAGGTKGCICLCYLSANDVRLKLDLSKTKRGAYNAVSIYINKVLASADIAAIEDVSSIFLQRKRSRSTHSGFQGPRSKEGNSAVVKFVTVNDSGFAFCPVTIKLGAGDGHLHPKSCRPCRRD